MQIQVNRRNLLQTRITRLLATTSIPSSPSHFPIASFRFITAGDHRFSVRNLEVLDDYEEPIDHGSICLQLKITKKIMKTCMVEFNYPIGMEIALPRSFKVAHICLLGFASFYLDQF